MDPAQLVQGDVASPPTVISMEEYDDNNNTSNNDSVLSMGGGGGGEAPTGNPPYSPNGTYAPDTYSNGGYGGGAELGGYSPSVGAVGGVVAPGTPPAAAAASPQAAAVPSAPPGRRVYLGEREALTAVHFTSYALPCTREVLSATGIPFGALVTPLACLEPTPPVLRRAPVRCGSCGGFINMYTAIELASGGWECVFCSGGNTNKAQFSDPNIENYPELIAKTVDYIDPADQPTGFVSQDKLAPVYVYVIDATIGGSDLHHLVDVMTVALSNLPANARVALISFSHVVSVYQIGRNGLASADVYPGVTSPSTTTISFLHENLVTTVSSLAYSRDNVLSIVQSMATRTTGAEVDHGKTSNVAARRALGTAVEIALSILSDAPAEQRQLGGLSAPQRAKASPEFAGGGRIMVITTGAANYGPGFSDVDEGVDDPSAAAALYFQDLASVANDLDFVVDVFCCGYRQFNTALLHSLVHGCGGAVLLHSDFDGTDFVDNVALAPQKRVGRQGRFDVRCSDPMVVTQIIGPGTACEEGDQTDPYGSPNMIRMGAVQRREAFTVVFEPEEDVVSSSVLFQFVVSFVNSNNERVHRVITRRIKTTNDADTYQHAVDVDAAAIVISKTAVLAARKSTRLLGLDHVHDALDEHIRVCASRFGSASDTGAGSLVYSMPFDLVTLPRKLFNLRRGPLLGDVLQNADEIDRLRAMFLRADYQDSARLMSPQLLAAGDGGFEEWPCDNLALQSNRILLLDTFTELTVWRGIETVGPGYDGVAAMCLQLAESIAADRYPRPAIREVKEYSSMARYVLAYLAPSHTDAPNEQVLALPVLASMTAEQREALQAKFFETDQMSFNQYYRSLFIHY